MPVGSSSTRLVIVRGPSASGKTAVALGLRRALPRGTAVIHQDVIRRDVMLREWDLPGLSAPDLIAANARFALDAGFDVVVEGILHRQRHLSMLTALIEDHLGQTGLYFLDVSWGETLRRHVGRPQSADFGIETLAATWTAHDVLGLPGEHVFGEDTTAEHTVARILDDVFADRRTLDGYQPSAAGRREAEAKAAAAVR